MTILTDDSQTAALKRQTVFKNAQRQSGAKIELSLACEDIPKLVREKHYLTTFKMYFAHLEFFADIAHISRYSPISIVDHCLSFYHRTR